MREIGQEKYKEIFEHYRKPDGKTSTVERETKVEEFGVAIEKPRNITKAQRSGKIHVPVDVGGGILLSYFAKCRKNEDIVRQEIAHRKIKLEEGVHLQLDAPPLQTMGLPEMKDLRLLYLLAVT